MNPNPSSLWAWPPVHIWRKWPTYSSTCSCRHWTPRSSSSYAWTPHNWGSFPDIPLHDTQTKDPNPTVWLSPVHLSESCPDKLVSAVVRPWNLYVMWRVLTWASPCLSANLWRSRKIWFEFFSRARAACIASMAEPHSSRSAFWKIKQNCQFNMKEVHFQTNLLFH